MGSGRRSECAKPPALPFIRQSIRSDYCAVYATAMFLSLLGCPTSRKQALRMFGARRGMTWPGASQADILTVIRQRLPGFSARWRRSAGSSSGLLRAFERAAGRGLPALVAAQCRHRSSGVECGHAFLLTGSSGGRLLLLDPLCRPPAEGEQHNANLRVDHLKDEQVLWTIEHSAWDLLARRAAGLLQQE